MRKRILIHVDDHRRDATTMNLLGLYLVEKGYEVIFGNRLLTRTILEQLKPEAAILSHISTIPPELLIKSFNDTLIFILPTENAAFNEYAIAMKESGLGIDKFNENKEPRNKYTQYVKKIFLWGEKAKEILLNNSIYREEQIVVSGNLRFDLLLSISKILRNHDSHKKVGFISRFNAINIFDRRPLITFIDQLRDGKKIRFTEKGNVEDFLWYNIALFRVSLEIIEALISKYNFIIDYRPHPFEYAKNYEAFVKKYSTKNFFIDYNTDFYEWLANKKVILAPSSTTIVESYILNIPTITFNRILNPKLSQHFCTLSNINIPFLKYTYQAGTIKEAVDLVYSALNNKLPPLDDNTFKINELLKLYYSWPFEEPACRIIATEVDNSLKDKRINRFDNKVFLNIVKKEIMNMKFKVYLELIKYGIKLRKSRYEVLKNTSYFAFDRKHYNKAKEVFKTINVLRE